MIPENFSTSFPLGENSNSFSATSYSQNGAFQNLCKFEWAHQMTEIKHRTQIFNKNAVQNSVVFSFESKFLKGTLGNLL